MLDNEISEKRKRPPVFSDLYASIPYRLTARFLASRLQYTRVTPNFISMGSGVAAVAACIALSIPSVFSMPLAICFIQLFEIFGALDGELTRLKKMFSPFGSYLNLFAERVGYFFITLGTVLYGYHLTGSVKVWVAGFFAIASRQLIAEFPTMVASKLPEGRGLIESEKRNLFIQRALFFPGSAYSILLSIGLATGKVFLFLSVAAVYGILFYVAALLFVGRKIYRQYVISDSKPPDRNA